MTTKVVMTYHYEVILTDDEYKKAESWWYYLVGQYDQQEYQEPEEIRTYVYNFVVQMSLNEEHYQNNVTPLGFGIEEENRNG